MLVLIGKFISVFSTLKKPTIHTDGIPLRLHILADIHALLGVGPTHEGVGESLPEFTLQGGKKTKTT